MNNFDSSIELKNQYKLEQSESLHKINRIAAWVVSLLMVYLAIFSDARNFSDSYSRMLVGRLIAIIPLSIVGILSFIPVFKKYGYVLSFIGALAPCFMMAHLTAVLDNHFSAVLAWILTNIIVCGIYPLPVGYSAFAVFIPYIYFLIMFFSFGFEADLDFRMTLVNTSVAALITLAFKVGMERVRRREFFFRTGLQKANNEIAQLNDKLQDENLRLSHELVVAQHIQSIVLPQRQEYEAFDGLDIACQMIPATEVGGDFYDAIQFGSGGIISIGDVTDHGLHSGIVMMMVHTALRTLSNVERDNIQQILKVINKILYDFRLKTSDHRIMSLLILKYIGNGDFIMTGQHETLLVFKNDGSVQDISSLEYGMFAGLDEDISSYLDILKFSLDPGEVLVLYTDGVTEAIDDKGQFFQNEGIILATEPFKDTKAETIKNSIIESCQNHIGRQKLLDDISVMVIKKT